MDPEWFNKSPRSAYNENPVVTRVDGGYMAVLDTVFNEHAGFGVSCSTDGLTWSTAADVSLEGGSRTPLGAVFDPQSLTTGILRVYFTRRFADCRNKTQQDDCGGFGMAMPSQCANIYSVVFRIEPSHEL